MNEQTYVNTEALTRLRRLGKGGQFVREIIDIFLNYAPQKIADAHAALRSGDLSAVAFAVHPLKSGAANVGAIVVQNLASQMEDLATETKGDTLPALLQDLDAAFAQTKIELEDAKKNLEP